MNSHESSYHIYHLHSEFVCCLSPCISPTQLFHFEASLGFPRFLNCGQDLLNWWKSCHDKHLTFFALSRFGFLSVAAFSNDSCKKKTLEQKNTHDQSTPAHKYGLKSAIVQEFTPALKGPKRKQVIQKQVAWHQLYPQLQFMVHGTFSPRFRVATPKKYVGYTPWN